MSERTQEITVNIPNQDRTLSSDLVIRFVFDESGNITRIEGDGPQHSYVGRLTLKGTALSPESGDHCVVCFAGRCEVEIPCPCD